MPISSSSVLKIDEKERRLLKDSFLLEHVQSWSADAPLHDVPEQLRDSYLETLSYFETFLVSSHPHKKGAVCPFMPKVLNSGKLRFFYLKRSSVLQTIATLKELGTYYLECAALYPSNSLVHVVLFDKDYPSKSLVTMQGALTSEMMRAQTMVATTFEGNSAPSLHDSSFHPFRTSVPCLIFRGMTVHDFAFLNLGKKVKPRLILAFARAFLKTAYDDERVGRAKHEDLEMVRELMRAAKVKIWTKRLLWVTVTLVAFGASLAMI